MIIFWNVGQCIFNCESSYILPTMSSLVAALDDIVADVDSVHTEYDEMNEEYFFSYIDIDID